MVRQVGRWNFFELGLPRYLASGMVDAPEAALLVVFDALDVAADEVAEVDCAAEELVTAASFFTVLEVESVGLSFDDPELVFTEAAVVWTVCVAGCVDGLLISGLMKPKKNQIQNVPTARYLNCLGVYFSRCR